MPVVIFRAWLVVFAVGGLPPAAGAPKGSLKRRLERALEDVNEEPPEGDVLEQPRTSLRRRAERARGSTEAVAETELPFTRTLRTEWAQGRISSVQVQRYAEDAAAQGAEGMTRLASAGSSGARPQHLQRAIMNFFGRPAGSPDFTWVRIPSPGGSTMHPVLLPHQVFGTLYHHRRELWNAWLRGPENAALDFWKALKDSSIVQGHPGLRDRGHWGMTLPLGLHGDGGAFSKQDSLFVISFNSLCAAHGSGEGFAKRFLFTIIRKRDLAPGTLDVLWRVFAWSVNQLLTGITAPTTWEDRPADGGGQFIAERWRAALVQIRGDWEFYANVLGLPSWSSAENMCWLCDASANIAHLAWQAAGPDAGWRATRRSHSSYLRDLRAKGRTPPLLLTIVVGLTLGCIMVDVLHAVDQGVASHVIANIFMHCIRKRVWGGATQAMNLAKLDEEIEAWCKEKKVKSRLQGKLTMERLRSQSGFPKLKCKAAATRHLSEFAYNLAVRHCQDDRRIVAVGQLLVEFYTLIEGENLHMRRSAIDRIAVVGRSLVQLYGQLARSALASNQKMWKVTPKHHIFLHLAEWQIGDLGLNPRSYWTYADEDLVGKLVECAEHCHPSTLSATALCKWVILAFAGDI